jgi:hypothetical protein
VVRVGEVQQPCTAGLCVLDPMLGAPCAKGLVLPVCHVPIVCVTSFECTAATVGQPADSGCQDLAPLNFYHTATAQHLNALRTSLH